MIVTLIPRPGAAAATGYCPNTFHYGKSVLAHYIDVYVTFDRKVIGNCDVLRRTHWCVCDCYLKCKDIFQESSKFKGGVINLRFDPW